MTNMSLGYIKLECCSVGCRKSASYFINRLHKSQKDKAKPNLALTFAFLNFLLNFTIVFLHCMCHLQ